VSGGVAELWQIQLLIAKMNYFIGIDGGGTKTKAILVDEKGNILAESKDAASNYHAVGKEETSQVLSNLFNQLSLLSGIDIEECRSICIGMAGLGRPDDQVIIRRICQKIGISSRNLILTHDAEIALIGGAMKNYGVLLNSGTGSIAYGIDRTGKSARASGWGHLLGDEGSAYDIAIQGLRAIVRAHDGRNVQTFLTQIILNRLGFDSPEQLVSWVYSVDKKDIAELASSVFYASAQKDQIANKIIGTAANELILSAKVVIEKLDFSGQEFDIVLSGGIFSNQLSFVQIIQKRLTLLIPNAKIHLPIHEPVYGAVMLASQLTLPNQKSEMNL